MQIEDLYKSLKMVLNLKYCAKLKLHEGEVFQLNSMYNQIGVQSKITSSYCTYS